ncbi:MAG: hypothetical protein IMZ52_04650 [Actinobacteria bacterium]|nr:hypothetical protein [Actinomycetota bacterium]MBE3114754.1 hypothetical protein [Actinomycetota bacterium]
MTESYTTNGKNGWWITTTNTTSTGTVNGSYTYPNSTYTDTTSNTEIWSSSLFGNREETPDEAFSKKKMVTTKDGNQFELTFAEIYELKRLKKIPEEMTKVEITDVLLVLRI